MNSPSEGLKLQIIFTYFHLHIYYRQPCFHEALWRKTHYMFYRNCKILPLIHKKKCVHLLEVFFCCLWFRVKAQNVWWKQIYRINSVNIHLVLLISCFYCLLSVSSSVWTDEERKTSLWKERPGLFTSTCTRDVAFTTSSSEWMTLYVAQVFTTTFLYLFDSFLSAWCKNKKEKLVTVSINV